MIFSGLASLLDLILSLECTINIDIQPTLLQIINLNLVPEPEPEPLTNTLPHAEQPSTPSTQYTDNKPPTHR